MPFQERLSAGRRAVFDKQVVFDGDLLSHARFFRATDIEDVHVIFDDDRIVRKTKARETGHVADAEIFDAVESIVMNVEIFDSMAETGDRVKAIAEDIVVDLHVMMACLDRVGVTR